MDPAVALGWFFVAILGAYLLHVFKKFREFLHTLYITYIIGTTTIPIIIQMI